MKSYNELIRHSGNQDLFRAVEMSIAALKNGTPFHIHAEGLRGTGKTSIMRAAKNILPPIIRIKGCIYNCHPNHPHCPEHRTMKPEEIANIGTETIPCPFLEVSHAAKLGTVVGSIDLSKLTNRLDPVAALLPGTVPQAHRGIIFIDEINRLADTSPELADVLLTVMGTKPGKIQIEESGLPVVDMPILVSVWAASNPDEEPGGLSQIRRQLADRFDMVISMGRPNDYQAVSMILNSQNYKPPGNIREDVLRNPNLGLELINSGDRVRSTLANIYIDFGIESLRAIEAIEMGARLNALISGRNNVINSDIISVVPLVLGHRTDNATITNILKYLDSLDWASNKMVLDQNSNSEIQHPEKKSAVISDSHGRTISWWEQFWQLLRSKLGLNKIANQAGNNRNHQQTSDNRKKSSTMGGGTQTSPVDPMKTEINAPAKPAVPLANLKIDQFVNDGEIKSHERQ